MSTPPKVLAAALQDAMAKKAAKPAPVAPPVSRKAENGTIKDIQAQLANLRRSLAEHVEGVGEITTYSGEHMKTWLSRAKIGEQEMFYGVTEQTVRNRARPFGTKVRVQAFRALSGIFSDKPMFELGLLVTILDPNAESSQNAGPDND